MSFAMMYVQTSCSLHSASGWIFQTPYRSERSTFSAVAREGDWSRRMPETQASYGRSVSISGSTFRMWQQRVALDEALTGLVRLLEEKVRVELDHVDFEPELGHHVHEDGRLLLPGAAEAESLAELLVGPEKDVLGRERLDLGLSP
jgi:hypothetical protein